MTTSFCLNLVNYNDLFLPLIMTYDVDIITVIQFSLNWINRLVDVSNA